MEANLYHPLMRTNSFYSPTRVVFGLNSLSRLREELRPFGFKKAMLISGTSVCNTEFYKSVRDTLSSMGALVEFTSIKPEPDYRIINALASEVRRGSFDLIVGLGGGSAMDSAKIASLLAANEKEPMNYFRGDEAAAKGPPIVTIPTIAGTGSEVTPITVMVVRKMKLALQHRHLYPALSIVDPALAVTSSPEATASAGIDALCHAVESIMSTSSNPITEALSSEAVSLVDEFLERAYFNGRDIEARNGLAMASIMAGMSFMNTGLCLAHGIAYTYAVGAALPHGVSVAIAEPYVISFNAPAIPDKLELIAAGLGIDTSGMEVDEVGYAVAGRIQDVMGRLRLPRSLSDIKLGRKDIGPMVDDLMKNYSRFISRNPRVPSRDDLVELYEEMVTEL